MPVPGCMIWLLMPLFRLLTPLLNLYVRLSRPQDHRYVHLDEYAWQALQQGDLAQAQALASELLERAQRMKRTWNYGNAIHEGHQVLGLVCLRQGSVAGTKEHLSAAGRTPGSPQLNSFGPRMSLAGELLRVGERRVVLEYLDLVARFWAKEDTRFPVLQHEHAALLRQWKATIRKGNVPKHRNWH